MQNKKTVSSFALIFVSITILAGIWYIQSRPGKVEGLSTNSIDVHEEINQSTTIVVETKNGNFNYEADLNGIPSLYTVLNNLAQNSDFMFEYEEYDFGIMINSINGIKPEKDEFWKIFINNTEASMGVNSIKVRPEDKITFKLEKIKF